MPRTAPQDKQPGTTPVIANTNGAASDSTAVGLPAATNCGASLASGAETDGDSSASVGALHRNPHQTAAACSFDHGR